MKAAQAAVFLEVGEVQFDRAAALFVQYLGFVLLPGHPGLLR